MKIRKEMINDKESYGPPHLLVSHGVLGRSASWG
jgi:hypothetical protein